MGDMNTETITKYASLKAELKRLDAMHEAMLEDYKAKNDFYDIENEVLEEMLAERIKSFATGYGNVTIREAIVYEHPDSWVQEIEEFKLRKKKLEKELLVAGRYSVNPTLLLSGKPKQLESAKPAQRGRLH